MEFGSSVNGRMNLFSVLLLLLSLVLLSVFAFAQGAPPSEQTSNETVAPPVITESVVSSPPVQSDAPTVSLVQEGAEIWKQTVVGYEPVYETIKKTTCDAQNVTCTSQDYSRKVVDPFQHGAPIYQKSLDSYNVSGKIVKHLQEREGCFICPSDNSKEVCYGYNDGFAENLDSQWKCACKSGTSCKVVNPLTDEVAYLRTDGELI